MVSVSRSFVPFMVFKSLVHVGDMSQLTRYVTHGSQPLASATLVMFIN